MDGPVNFATVVGSSTSAVEAVDIENQVELYAIGNSANGEGMRLSAEQFAKTFYPLAASGVNTFQLAADDIDGMRKEAVKLNGGAGGWESVSGETFNFVSTALAKMSQDVPMTSWNSASLVNVKKSLQAAKNLNNKSNPAHCLAALDADELAALINDRKGETTRTASTPVAIGDQLVLSVRVQNAHADIPDIEFQLNYMIVADDQV